MPDRPRVVVVNTTPLIGLALLGRLDLLGRLYGEVVIPPAVEAEFLTGAPRPPGRAELKEASWVHVQGLQDPRRADLLGDLDRGEAEVIALAQELNADMVLIDERLGRSHAKRLGLRVSGLIGVLLKAKEAGLVDAIGPLIVELRRGGIWLGDELVAEALRLAGEG